LFNTDHEINDLCFSLFSRDARFRTSYCTVANLTQHLLQLLADFTSHWTCTFYVYDVIHF